MDRTRLFLISVIVLLAGASGWLGYFVMAIPAPTTPTIIEPGSASNNCSYNIYLDTASSSPTVMAKNCQTGANDFSGATADVVLQLLCNFMSTHTVPNYAIVGGEPSGTQWRIDFSPGNYFFSSTVNCNLGASTGGGVGLSLWGVGDNRVMLTLSNAVNKNMFNYTGGSIFTLGMMKVEGNSAAQSGGQGDCIWVNAPEITVYSVEFRDCLTNGFEVAGANGGSNSWNIFQDVWFLNCGNSGLDLSYSFTGLAANDVRIIGSKFEACAKGIYLSAGNTADVSIVGNNFNNAGILLSIGSVKTMSIAGNIFWNAPTNVIDFGGTALGSLTNFNAIVSANQFVTATGTNVAIIIRDFVDGITVTSNQFSGYTSSATVPVTLIQTHQKLSTLVTQNSGMGAFWTGFGISQPAVGASTVNVKNTNPYGVLVFITATGTGITAYKITDPSGTAVTFIVAVAIGFSVPLDPYAQIALTYTGSPTWQWYGQANLT